MKKLLLLCVATTVASSCSAADPQATARAIKSLGLSIKFSSPTQQQTVIPVVPNASCSAADKATKKAAAKAQAIKEANATHNANMALMSPGYIPPYLHQDASFTAQQQIHQHNLNRKQ